MRTTVLCCALLGITLPGPGHAQSPDTLTAERVIALACTRAPQVRVAESDLIAARGRLSAARALARENPTLEGVAPRPGRFERRTQWELNVPIGVGLHWAGRTGLASAELRAGQHLAAHARLGAVGNALAGYYRVLHASRRVELARERRSLSVDLARAATERHRTGEIPRLELLVAETEEARAESELLNEEQGVFRARLELAAALGLAFADVVVAGELADLSVLAHHAAADPQDERPDVLAAEQGVRAARAASRLAIGELLPALAFRLNYGHDAGEPLVQPGLAVTLPLFQYGQDGRALARARLARAEAELDRVRAAASSERSAFRAAFDAARAAADRLGSRVLPRVEESEGMAMESYRAGKLDLPSLIVIRRELLDARREQLDRLLDAALAGVDLATAEGTFQ